MLRIAGTLALVALASSTSAQDLWILDASGGPGADFTALSDAIAGAGEGDVILIRPGSYSEGTIDGKGLVLLGDGTGTVSIHALTVTNLGPGGRLIARGLHVSGWTILQDCAGSVWLEDSTFDVPPFLFGGIHIERCDDVVLSRCATFPIYPVSGSGARATESTVVVHDSILRGGHGIEGDDFFGISPGDGGHGIALQDSTLVVAGSELIGGTGGAASCIFCGPPGKSGDGIHAESSTIQYVDSIFLGGGGAFPGQDVHLIAATIEKLANHALDLATTAPATALSAVDVGFEGVPGALVFLGLGTGPASFTGPALLGQILIAGPYAVVPVGAIGPGGTVQVRFATPPVFPGTEAGVYWLQSLMVTPVGGVVPGAPSVVVVVP
jgi:hypothetical protein